MNIATSPGTAAVYRTLISNAPRPVAKEEPARQPNKRLRVLLVDDDDADVYLIRRALAEIPRVVEVKVARDGVDAMEVIDSWSSTPDLAIVDLKMPRKDGFTLLRELSARKSVTFPSLVLTSSKAGADAYRAKKRGAAEFMTKPNGLEKLRTVLAEAIAKI